MNDAYDHHVGAKLASDKSLEFWRNNTWSNDVVSEKVIAYKSSHKFPSPDATFYDEVNKRKITFEFKPPTETKRGMLTAIGQAIAYIDKSSMSYIISPQKVDGFEIAKYLEKLFSENIKGRLPVGLIKYSNEDPAQLEILVDIDTNTISKKEIELISEEDEFERYWAKWQDFPFELLFYILEYAYLEKSEIKRGKLIWEKVWTIVCLQNGEVTRSLDKTNPTIKYPNGTPYRKALKIKNGIIKRFKEGKYLSEADALQELRDRLDLYKKWGTKKSNYSQSEKRYLFAFLNHCKLWDENFKLTESGLNLHHKGKIYGKSSKIFADAIKKETLFAGKHYDLILDLHTYGYAKSFKTKEELMDNFIDYYNDLGKIKWNKNRGEGGFTKQFKNEERLWGHCNFITKNNSKNYFIEGIGLDFNWREITRICSL